MRKVYNRLLKENIDGEALLWAYNRISDIASLRRLIVVISDGAPVDDSTLSVNRADFLFDHLKYVVGQIEIGGIAKVLGVGIGHRLSDRYSDYVFLDTDNPDLSEFISKVEYMMTS